MAKICEVCGKEFEPKTANSKYCSDKCRDVVIKIRRREGMRKTRVNKRGTKICPQCGMEFNPHDIRQKYCSDQCRNKAHNTKQRAKKLEIVPKPHKNPNYSQTLNLEPKELKLKPHHKMTDSERWLMNYKRVRRKDRLAERSMVASALDMKYSEVATIDRWSFEELEAKAIALMKERAK